MLATKGSGERTPWALLGLEAFLIMLSVLLTLATWTSRWRSLEAAP